MAEAGPGRADVEGAGTGADRGTVDSGWGQAGRGKLCSLAGAVRGHVEHPGPLLVPSVVSVLRGDPHRWAHILTPRTCDRGVWRKGFCRRN